MAALLCVSLVACSRAATPSSTTQIATAASAPEVVVERDSKGMPLMYSVVAYGYNYTDLYIDSFEIDGAGGGNLAVSTPDSPGGGHTCCARVSSGLPLGYKFNIKWTRDRKLWCQQDVPLTKPIPKDPHYFEVHFYSDGKVEIEVTQRASRPRLALDSFTYARRKETGNVNNDEKYSRCKNGYD
jgi:Protein of unknown function (DUF3304)